ncbi:Epithelial membrane protein 3 [Acipenser ruthenus]|uniref:Epithelial membrane protein 3 n=1 Tax=Acipenser ruthenus TaxID=7906 RepID=A0A444UXW4_ACIRT|nr:Epithelial membrane protein 3 [Acipenser ruthenus]
MSDSQDASLDEDVVFPRVSESSPEFYYSEPRRRALECLLSAGPAAFHTQLSLEHWLHAVQALMVVSVLFSAVSFLLFLCQLYSLRRGGLFYITGMFQIFAGLTVFSASLIYSLHAPEILSDSSLPPAGHFGYCFVVAWLCVPALLFSGVLYIHLRKKE